MHVSFRFMMYAYFLFFYNNSTNLAFSHQLDLLQTRLPDFPCRRDTSIPPRPSPPLLRLPLPITSNLVPRPIHLVPLRDRLGQLPPAGYREF